MSRYNGDGSDGGGYCRSISNKTGMETDGTGRIFGYTRLGETVGGNLRESVIVSIIVDERRCWETKEDDGGEIISKNVEVAI